MTGAVGPLLPGSIRDGVQRLVDGVWIALVDLVEGSRGIVIERRGTL
jgi:hypothetical protein